MIGKTSTTGTKAMSADDKVHEFAGGEVYFYIQQSTIHIKAVSPKGSRGDPVELTENEATRLAIALQEAVKQIEAEDA